MGSHLEDYRKKVSTPFLLFLLVFFLPNSSHRALNLFEDLGDIGSSTRKTIRLFDGSGFDGGLNNRMICCDTQVIAVS